MLSLTGKKEKDKMDDLKKELEVDVHRIPIDECYRRFGCNPTTGLTSIQARAGLEKHGPNAILAQLVKKLIIFTTLTGFRNK